MLLRLLTHIVRQCGASPDAVGLLWRWVRSYGSRQCPVTTTISVGDGVLDVPCLVCRCILRQTTAPCYVGASGAYVYLRALRVVTHGVVVSAQREVPSPYVNPLWRPSRNAVASPHAPCGNRRRTYLPHNTAQARCGRASPSLVGTRRQFAASCSLARVVQPRDRL
jgi:hypothetical protein